MRAVNSAQARNFTELKCTVFRFYTSHSDTKFLPKPSSPPRASRSIDPDVINLIPVGNGHGVHLYLNYVGAELR